MLGHADVKQIATYLNAERVGLYESMKWFGTAPLWQSVAKERPSRGNRQLAANRLRPAASHCQLNGLTGGARAQTRTGGLPLRRRVLYPPELHAHFGVNRQFTSDLVAYHSRTRYGCRLTASGAIARESPTRSDWGGYCAHG
jgi:hypothetical protein